MKVRFLICCLFLISILNMKAQENFSAYANIKMEPTEKINFSETNVGIFYQKKLGSKNQISNTLEYSNLKVNHDLNQYDFYSDQERFNQIQNNFRYSNQILAKTKLGISVIPTANFQENLDFDAITVLGNLEIEQ